MGRGGSTAVTAILINGRRLWIANVGDSRAVLSKKGQALQMTTDHEPNTERGSIENRGGFVSNLPGTSELPLFQFMESVCLQVLVSCVDLLTLLICSYHFVERENVQVAYVNFTVIILLRKSWNSFDVMSK